VQKLVIAPLGIFGGAVGKRPSFPDLTQITSYPQWYSRSIRKWSLPLS